MIKHNDVVLNNSVIKSAIKVLKSGHLSTQKYVKELEEFISKKYYRSGFCVAVSSGTAALYLAIKALSNKAKPRILIPTYSCSALLNAIYMANAQPVLTDINSKNLTLDYSKNYKNIDIVIAVNIFGSEPNLKDIKKKFKSAKIILDACQSLGKKIDTNDLNLIYPDIIVHSLYSTKIIGVGHGGLIWSKKKQYTKFCKDFVNFDNKLKYKKRFNFLLSDMQAKIATEQLKLVDQNRKFRNNLFSIYKKNLSKNAKFFNFFNINDIIYRAVIIFKSKKKRDNFKKYMKNNGIESIVPICNFELLHNYLNLKKTKFKNAEKISELTLSIPFYESLKKKNILKITNCLRKI